MDSRINHDPSKEIDVFAIEIAWFAFNADE